MLCVRKMPVKLRVEEIYSSKHWCSYRADISMVTMKSQATYTYVRGSVILSGSVAPMTKKITEVLRTGSCMDVKRREDM